MRPRAATTFEPITRSRRLVSLIAAVTVASLASGQAMAQCVETPGPERTSLDCDGTLTPYDAGTTSSIDVVINPGATLDVPSGAGFRLLGDNTVEHSGAIDVSGGGAIGIDLQEGGNQVNPVADEADPPNDGAIDVTGNGAVGIRAVHGGTDALNSVINDGTLNVTGLSSIGIQILDPADDDSTEAVPTVTSVQNRGAINVTTGSGIAMAGVEVGDRTKVVNGVSGQMGALGVIDVSAVEASGIRAGENSVVENYGTISVTGAVGLGVSLVQPTNPAGLADATTVPAVINFHRIEVGAPNASGIRMESGARVELRAAGLDGDGLIVVQGDQTESNEAIGVEVTHNAVILNDGELQVSGENNAGIAVGDYAPKADPDEPGNAVSEPRIRFSASSKTTVSGTDQTVGLFVDDDWGLNPDDGLPRVNLEGTWIVSGTRSAGVEAGDDTIIGTIRSNGAAESSWTISGAGSTGIYVGRNSSVFAGTPMAVGGADAIAIDVGANDLAGVEDGEMPDFLSVAIGAALTSEAGAGPLVNFRESGLGQNVMQVFSGGSLTAAAGTLAVRGSVGADLVINDSEIVGDIDLGDGLDGFRNVGTYTGTLDFGEEDDIFESAPNSDFGDGTTIVGGSGNDEVHLVDLQLAGAINRFSIEAQPFQGFEALRIRSGAYRLSGDDSGATFPAVRVHQDAFYVFTNQDATTIGGDLVFETGSFLGVDWRAEDFADPEAGEVIRVEGGGGVTIEDGVRMSVRVLDADITELGFGVVGFDVIESPNGFTGGFSDILTDPQWEARIDSSDPTRLRVEVAFQGWSSFAGTANQIAFGGHLDDLTAARFAADLGPAVSELLTLLLSLDEAALIDAYDQLVPQAYDAGSSALLAMGDRHKRLLFDRPRLCVANPNEIRRDPRTGLACRTRPVEPWIGGFGQFRSLDATKESYGHESSGGGAVFGVDFRPDKYWRLTASIGGGYSDFTSTGAARGNVSSLELGLASNFSSGPWRVQGAFLYGRGRQDTSRELSIEGWQRSLVARTYSNRYSLRVEADYAFDLKGWSLAPVGALDYTLLQTDATREIGARDAGLDLVGDDHSIVTVGVGLLLETTYRKDDYWTQLLESADGVWHPRLGIRWRQTLTGADRTIESRFIDGTRLGVAPFATHANDADGGFEIAAGIDFIPARANRITVGLYYDGFVWTDINSHDVGINFRFGF